MKKSVLTSNAVPLAELRAYVGVIRGSERAIHNTMSSRSRPHLVLVGAGHAHLLVLAGAIRRPLTADVTLVTDRPDTVYSGMVPGFIARQYGNDEIRIDAAGLARRAGARVVIARVTGVEPSSRELILARGDPLGYDVASVDVGARSPGPGIPGAGEHALPTRPIAGLLDSLDAIDGAVRTQRDGGRPTRIVIVGAGAGGVELAFTLRQRLDPDRTGRAAISLVDRGARVLAGYPERAARLVTRNARTRGITIHLEAPVERVETGRLHLTAGVHLPWDALIWAADPVGPALFRTSGLPVDEHGFLPVHATMESEISPALFAAGDCAAFRCYPHLPKAGVHAVRQAPLLEQNLRDALAGRRPTRTFIPARAPLALLNLGDGSAIAVKGRWSASGPWMMHLKDRIDRRFVDRFARATSS